MTIALWAAVAILLLFGFLGCFVNKFPGPICVVLSLLIAKLGLEIPIEWGVLAVLAVLAIASMYMSKKLVAQAKKICEFSKRATWGTTIGSIIGLLVMLTQKSSSTPVLILFGILGLVVIPFVGAFLFESGNKQSNEPLTKRATAATAAYLADTLLKLVVFVSAILIVIESFK